MDTIGVLTQYQGRALHDRWHSYDQYPCAHSVCGAHLLRDCRFVAEQEKRPWAQAMDELLLQMHETALAFRAQGERALPSPERDALMLQYFEVLRQGFAEQKALAPPPSGPPAKKPGRKRESASKNLLDALLAGAEQVLAFLDDLSIPFTNNQAERDLRMIKVQQKISGTFRESGREPQLFAPFAVICPPCASRAAPGFPLWLRSLRGPPVRLHGSQGPEE